jgi:amino acid adenylation domain-containing protein
MMEYLLQHLLINAAKGFPDKEAVVFKDQRISYRELDRLTDKLAATLRENGVKRGDRVAIYLNKSIPSVVCILGILKAGAVYIPLDPNAPLQRIAYIMENAGVRCLLASTRKVEKIGQLQPGMGAPAVVIVTDGETAIPSGLPAKVISWDAVLRNEGVPTPAASLGTDLAYILYTSGSTGTPKGVMISHLNALTFVNWSFDEFGLQPADRVSSHAPLHFDLSIFDIFTSIKAGATICLVPEEYSVFPRRLIRFIQDARITVWYSVPSILVHMLVHGSMSSFEFPALRQLLFAGEVFPVKYLRELMRILPGVSFYNLYGPTETNVCTFHRVEDLPEDQVRPVPIGRASGNTEVFALDENLQRIEEPHKKGELYVRGSIVAQGYWGDRQKTEAHFIPNIFIAEYQDRMYRTGDIVFLDERGDYHLVGRRDHMIKSRGYRIELGEIEANLCSHPGVKEAVVVAIPDELITNRLKAFIVPLKKGSIATGELERFLAERIPGYMVPGEIAFVESLPKVSTGKIDRKMMSDKRVG